MLLKLFEQQVSFLSCLFFSFFPPLLFLLSFPTPSGQIICGIDMLRAEDGKTYVFDINGWSSVKSKSDYHQRAGFLSLFSFFFFLFSFSQIFFFSSLSNREIYPIQIFEFSSPKSIKPMFFFNCHCSSTPFLNFLFSLPL